MKESYLYKKISKNKIQCKTCAHFCFLAPNERGKCGVRENIDGKLYALNYGKIIACHIDPIEKKPFFHFLPGNHSLSIATVGCNFSCLNCQNFDISQKFKEVKEIPGENISPERIIAIAKENNLPSIAYTYTEPTIFLEYALDTMKLAKKAKIKNVWVSNGFLSKESAKLVIPFLDAINIDIKGFSENFYQKVCGARLKPILETAKLMKKAGVWVEITTLVIPTLSDSKEMFKNIANFIKKELGSETPWHITQFCGVISWKLQNVSNTPIKTLERAYKIGKELGLKYVYVGNIPGHQAENTYCPKCGALAISRVNYTIHRYDKKGKCVQCGTDLNLILN